MRLILIIGILLITFSCSVKKYDNNCDAYWSGNPNHTPGE
jgi:hypothetical protein